MSYTTLWNLSFVFCKWTAIRNASQKTHQMLLSLRLQNQADSDNILYLLSWIYLPQSVINIFHLTSILRLHYLVKVKIRVFVKILMLEKGNSFDFDFTYQKDATFGLWHHVVANLIRKTCTKLYHSRPCFVKDMAKTFWCVFRFTVLTAVHLQNANAKFHKVG